MNIAIIGYGKMGHEIETIATERGHKIALAIDMNNTHELNPVSLKMVDVAIEFTTPETAFKNIEACLKAGVPTVCGTTGWLNKLDEAKHIAQQHNTAFFYASNYSIGVNLFFKVNQLLAKLANRYNEYDVSIEEIHHTQKKDAPSGTAISIAQIISKELNKYNDWSLLPEFYDDRIPIKAIRKENIPGTHSVFFDSEQDQITLTHKAKSRKGFALGAVLAAEFSLGKKGFLTMDNLLNG
ncbi:MAG: 4-hydroxy-tetrahydrodipicolinate reductase [Bacteroidales bacterium]|nr:4-hydroxy-tetrahydrodipicolinate reductase [Bacteroidales bacterium]